MGTFSIPTDDRTPFDHLAKNLYESHKRRFTPMYPWVFVFVLPREQTYKGLLHLPGKQNKTVLEGVVLATWQPRGDEDGWDKISNLSPGDHVLFPHWCGLPVVDFETESYRIVKEAGWTKDQDGGIIATVDYSEKSTHDKLVNLIGIHMTRKEIGFSWNDLLSVVQEIETKFVVTDRESYSVTLSGR